MLELEEAEVEVSRSWPEVVSVGSVGEVVKRVSRLRSTQPTSRRKGPIVPSFLPFLQSSDFQLGDTQGEGFLQINSVR